MSNAKFIVFEGIDGAGKSTQIALLREALSRCKIKTDCSAEPTSLPSGVELRRALSGELRKTPLEMAEMFATDRVAHNIEIEKLLSDGVTVISDRYYYSSLAYQGSVLGYDAVAKLNLDNPGIRRPDICIFLDLSPEKSLARIGGRGANVEIYENLEYLTKTRKMFFDVFERLKSKGENIAVIDASGSVETVANAVFDAVCAVYGGLEE